MGEINIKLNDGQVNALAKKLRAMNAVRFAAVVKKNVTQMLNTARSGGTPVSTEQTRPGGPHGELRQSSGAYGDEMGYTKEYAPHVEYGHRTKNKKWVAGQRFLQKNVDAQRFIYYQDLLKAVRKG